MSATDIFKFINQLIKENVFNKTFVINKVGDGFGNKRCFLIFITK